MNTRIGQGTGYSPADEAAREVASNDQCAKWFLRGELAMLGTLTIAYGLFRLTSWLLS